MNQIVATRRHKPAQPFLLRDGEHNFILFPSTLDYEETMAAIDDLLLTETLRDAELVERAGFQLIGRPLMEKQPVS